MSQPLRILGIAGSLREGSYNRALLKAAVALAPDGVEIEVFDIAGIPAYNWDVQEVGFPAEALRFGERLEAADAVLFVTPEYNYSIPGVLKNAIDWASRLPSQPLAGMPGAVMGASMGMLGTARAQYHLRQVAVFVDMHLMNKPEVMVAAAHTKFDSSGDLADETTRGLVRGLLESLATWTRRLKAAEQSNI